MTRPVSSCTDITFSSGTHTLDHLSTLIDDHYKPEDIDFHLWNEQD